MSERLTGGSSTAQVQVNFQSVFRPRFCQL